MQTTNLTHAQKAAAIIVAIGRPHALSLLRKLSESEIRTIMDASRTLAAIAPATLEAITGQFEVEFAKGARLFDSAEQISAIVSEALGADGMARLSGVERNEATDPVVDEELAMWERVATVDPVRLAEFLQQENPQFGAFVLTRLPNDQAAKVLAVVERPLRATLLERMLELGDPSTDMSRFVASELAERFTSGNSGPSRESASRVATLLNELDGRISDAVIEDLSLFVGEETVNALKSMLFHFDQIPVLDGPSRATVFDDIPADTIAAALGGADAGIAEAILSAISQRLRRMIEADLKTTSRFRPSDIADARKKITARVLKLIADGRIVLPDAGDRHAA